MKTLFLGLIILQLCSAGPARANKMPLAIHVSLECFSNWLQPEAGLFKKQGPYRQCPPEFYQRLKVDLKDLELFAEIEEANELSFLERNQVIIRIDYEGPTKRPSWFAEDRIYSARWRAWNRDGLLADQSKIITYTSTRPASIDQMASWHMEIAKKTHAELEKTFNLPANKSGK